MVYTNPRPSKQNLQQYYESSNYISHAEKSQNLTDRIYYLARYFMLRQKLRWIKKILNSKGRVLDYGCGTGSFISLLLKRKWDAWGIEPNAQARNTANHHASKHIFDSLEHLPQNQFNVITLWHVLEHVFDLESVMNELLKRLTSSGYIVIAVPNCSSYDAKYYKEQWAAYDVPRHLFHFTPETMKLLVKKYKLHLTKIIPLKLDAFYISIQSEKYRNGSFFKGLYHGAKSNILAHKNPSTYSSLVYVLRK